MRFSRPLVIPLVGASTTAQMTENLTALEISLNADEMEQLNGAVD